ncbi:MAG: hypothetical protein UR81_C0019G0011 [Candidatus Levybacteria bacterium GW2011_GWB1_35_5]|nr:MAG: hypothetical protein UR81_C0019G0011 [Candidatus Levybacteria bacterium GW2011_GWB1_35_5]
MSKILRHYEDSTFIPASQSEIFVYVDDHKNFSSHMSKSSWMMGGGSMDVKLDEGSGKKVGSHIKLSGKVFGIKIYLDEIITTHEPPKRKEWQTVGSLRLLVIGNYRMGFEISPESQGSRLKVFIDYDMPTLLYTRWLGYLFGGIYAKWCVQQMIKGSRNHFVTKK